MSLTGITFANQKITPSDDGRLYGSVLSDGILTGCAVTFAAATLSIAAGSMLIGTRELRTSGETLSITGATSGYARVIVDIDLTRAATKTSFEQAQLQIEYAASQDAFPALVQQDINAAGTHYQTAFCVVSLGSAGITAVVSKLGLSRIASGRLGDGAVQTANIGDGVVTRAKLAQDAVALPFSAWLPADNPADPFIASNHGKVLYVQNTTAVSYELTAEKLAALPLGFTVTIFKALTGDFTISWPSGISCDNFAQRSWSTDGGSFTLAGWGDVVTLFKESQSGIALFGHRNARSIYIGTSDSPPSYWRPGDVYYQYQE